MKSLLKCVLILFSLGLFGVAHTAPKVVFGLDERMPLAQAPQVFSQLAQSVGVMFSPIYMSEAAPGFVNLDFGTHEENVGLCQNQRFAKLPTAAVSCTGFLVAPNLVATAGHCMINHGRADNAVTPFCSDFKWYFGLEMGLDGRTQLENIPSSEIYSCKRVIRTRHETTMSGPNQIDFFGQDYALIELDRPVVNRPVLKLSKDAPKISERLSMIGHPNGLPKMVVPRGSVQKNSEELYFEAALDSFAGNSGSPVFNSKREVVGILVRGPDDYVDHRTLNCVEVHVCRENGSNCASPNGIARAHVNRVGELIELLEAQP